MAWPLSQSYLLTECSSTFGWRVLWGSYAVAILSTNGVLFDMVDVRTNPQGFMSQSYLLTECSSTRGGPLLRGANMSQSYLLTECSSTEVAYVESGGYNGRNPIY